MISIKKMHEWVFEDRCDLSFVFVDYKHQDGKLEVLKQSKLIPIEQLSWNCLSIEAQGYGVIQMCRTLEIVPPSDQERLLQRLSHGIREIPTEREEKA